jgi:hypothetical protein
MLLMRQSDQQIKDRYRKSAQPLRQSARQAQINVAGPAMGGVISINHAGNWTKSGPAACLSLS